MQDDQTPPPIQGQTPPSIPVDGPSTPPGPDPMDPRVRYPNMKDCTPPSLFTLNSFGMGMYGKRDFDEETGCYIKTRCFCALFIPLFPIDSYRVADAEDGGWYFLGKEKLGVFPRFWRKWSVIILAVIIATAVWRGYQSSPGRMAKVRTEEAQQLASDGKTYEAAEAYRKMVFDGLGVKSTHIKAISALLMSEINSGDPKRIAKAFNYAEKNSTLSRTAVAIIPDKVNLALEKAAACSAPEDAELILTSIKPTPVEVPLVHKALKPVLEQLYDKDPDNMERRIKLALIKEEFGEEADALELLAPAADQLGGGEGARLYGVLLMQEGREVEAIPHLDRYVSSRVKNLQAAEQALDDVYTRARNKEFDILNATGGPPGFIERYEAASEDDQILMVEEYISERLERNGAFLRARQRYIEQTEVVSSIMALGVARLRAAQSAEDPATRKGLLKEAEETFLSMQSISGQDDEYRFFLGQVYYWSGQENKGSTLFKELLASTERSYGTLYSLGQVYRELGEDTKAVKLLKECFEKGTNVEERSGPAQTLALLAETTDEKIEWLRKGDLNNPWLASSLAQAQGEQAEYAGRDVEAIKHYKDSLTIYDKMERSASSLNNSATVYQAMYRIEGKREHFDLAAQRFAEAVELSPGRSILTSNAASSLLNASVLHVIGDRVDPRLLKEDQGIDLLRYLYSNEKEKSEVIGALKKEPNFRKAVALYWDALLLAPKSPSLYSEGAEIFTFIRDEDAMQRLAEKAAAQKFDHSRNKELFEEYLNKAQDEDLRESTKNTVDSAAALIASLKDSPKALGMARSVPAYAHMSAYSFEEDIKPGLWLADLEKAIEQHRCSTLVVCRNQALSIIALRRLAADDAECRKIIESNRRKIGHNDQILLLVRAKGALGERVRKHPAVLRCIESTQESNQNYPASYNLYDWLLEGSGADLSLRDRVKANKAEMISLKLQGLLSYDSPSSLMTQYWLNVFEGNAAGTKQVRDKLTKAGVMLPEMQ